MLAKGPVMNALRLWGKKQFNHFPAPFLLLCHPDDLQEVQGDLLSFLMAAL